MMWNRKHTLVLRYSFRCPMHPDKVGRRQGLGLRSLLTHADQELDVRCQWGARYF